MAVSRKESSTAAASSVRIRLMPWKSATMILATWSGCSERLDPLPRARSSLMRSATLADAHGVELRQLLPGGRIPHGVESELLVEDVPVAPEVPRLVPV